jgi:hypothetical protein
MCVSAAPSSENDHGSMNFASNTAPLPTTMPSRVAPHPSQHRMQEPILNAFNNLTGVALVPMAVEAFGDEIELDEKVVGGVLRQWLLCYLPLTPA